MSNNIISMDVLDPRPNVVVGGTKTLILVDYSNLLYRSYFSCMRDIELKPWLPFMRCLDMLRTCIQKCRKRNPISTIDIIFCGDSVRQKLDRMKVDENYKADRPALTNLKFYTFRYLMNQVLDALGQKVHYFYGQEGDDVIASIVKKHCKDDKCTCTVPCKVC